MNRRKYLSLCGAVSMVALAGCQSPTDVLQSSSRETEDQASRPADTDLGTLVQSRVEQLSWLEQSDGSRSQRTVTFPIISTGETPTQVTVSTQSYSTVQYVQTTPPVVPNEPLQTEVERIGENVLRHRALQSVSRVSYSGDILMLQTQIDQLREQIVTPETVVADISSAGETTAYTVGEQLIFAGYGEWSAVMPQSVWQQQSDAQLIGTVDKTRQFDTYSITTLLDAIPFAAFKTDLQFQPLERGQTRLLTQWTTTAQPQVSDRAREAYPNSIDWVCGIRIYDITSTAERDALYETRRLAAGQSQDGISGVRTPIVTIDKLGASAMVEYIELPLPLGEVVPWSIY